MALTLVRASHAVRRAFIDTLAQSEVTPQQFNVLLHLVERPGISQADLAREVLAAPQSVGELLHQMEVRGMVERTPPTRRGLPNAVSATPKGRELLVAVTPRVLEAFSPETLGLNQATHDRVNADLHAILTALTG